MMHAGLRATRSPPAMTHDWRGHGMDFIRGPVPPLRPETAPETCTPLSAV